MRSACRRARPPPARHRGPQLPPQPLQPSRRAQRRALGRKRQVKRPQLRVVDDLERAHVHLTPLARARTTPRRCGSSGCDARTRSPSRSRSPAATASSSAEAPPITPSCAARRRFAQRHGQQQPRRTGRSRATRVPRTASTTSGTAISSAETGIPSSRNERPSSSAKRGLPSWSRRLDAAPAAARSGPGAPTACSESHRSSAARRRADARPAFERALENPEAAPGAGRAGTRPDRGRVGARRTRARRPTARRAIARRRRRETPGARASTHAGR